MKIQETASKKKTMMYIQIRLDNVREYQKVVDAEWQILYEKLAALHASGANVVLSMLPIGDVATQYFADRSVTLIEREREVSPSLGLFGMMERTHE